MKTLIPLSLLVIGLSGCVMGYEEGRVGPLGYTVYQDTYQQIADKERAANPGTEISPVGVDGLIIEQALDTMRTPPSDTWQVGQPIQINVGGGSLGN